MTTYYNEHDEYAAQWLRNLIAAGHIAPGHVDTRSIEDVRPDDLIGYTQCHFFAGVGVWSHALRRAGWPDDRPVWTGSCPCQPFSSAGAGLGFADERHLWPAFNHLIAKRRPTVVLGEQVASAPVHDWIDLVHADLEALGYAFGSVPFPSAGVGAPHIRDRAYWVAHAMQPGRSERRAVAGDRSPAWGSTSILAGDPGGTGLAQRVGVAGIHGGETGRSEREAIERTGVRSIIGVGDPNSGTVRWNTGTGDRPQRENRHGVDRNYARSSSSVLHYPGPANGFWGEADWLGCKDGKRRPVEPGTFPLAHGATSRVGRLRAYGNAINAEAARVFIESVMECT